MFCSTEAVPAWPCKALKEEAEQVTATLSDAAWEEIGDEDLQFLFVVQAQAPGT